MAAAVPVPETAGSAKQVSSTVDGLDFPDLNPATEDTIAVDWEQIAQLPSEKPADPKTAKLRTSDNKVSGSQAKSPGQNVDSKPKTKNAPAALWKDWRVLTGAGCTLLLVMLGATLFRPGSETNPTDTADGSTSPSIAAKAQDNDDGNVADTPKPSGKSGTSTTTPKITANEPVPGSIDFTGASFRSYAKKQDTREGVVIVSADGRTVTLIGNAWTRCWNLTSAVRVRLTATKSA